MKMNDLSPVALRVLQLYKEREIRKNEILPVQVLSIIRVDWLKIGINTHEFNTALFELIAEGFIREVDDGKNFALTDKGDVYLYGKGW
jgi:predicted transcriptional regulator